MGACSITYTLHSILQYIYTLLKPNSRQIFANNQIKIHMETRSKHCQRQCNRLNLVVNYGQVVLGGIAIFYGIFLASQDHWYIGLFSSSIAAWGLILMATSWSYSSCGYKSICYNFYYSIAMFSFAFLNVIGCVLLLMDKDQVVSYIKAHSKGVPTGMFSNIELTLQITLYCLLSLTTIITWAASVALCHRQRLIQAESDPYDTYVGISEGEEPEQIEGGRRYSSVVEPK